MHRTYIKLTRYLFLARKCENEISNFLTMINYPKKILIDSYMTPDIVISLLNLFILKIYSRSNDIVAKQIEQKK